MMTFWKEEIEPIKRRVEEYIRGKGFAALVKSCTGEGFFARYYPALREACVGGKCLRGYLVSLGYFLAAGEPLKDMRPAAAFEVFQGGILAHDDIIDESPLRRGKPSLYMALGGGKPGASRAICLGDLTIGLAEALLARSAFPAERRLRALGIFSEVISRTAAGEAMDIDLGKADAGEEDILAMYALKTAPYSVAGPLAVGAALGGGEEALLSSLYEFGMLPGIAFQIRDDIAGIFAEEAETGKSLSDAEEGKSTLLTAYFSRTAAGAAREEFFSLYGTPALTSAQMQRIRTLLLEAGAKSYAEGKAEEYERRALARLEGFPSPAKEKLAAFCAFLSGKK